MARVISSDRPHHIFLRMKQERKIDQEPDVVDETAMSVDESYEEIEMVEDESSVESAGHEASSDSQASESVDIQDGDVSKTLRSFGDWLLSPDGGKKDGKTAKQHVSQLNKVLFSNWWRNTAFLVSGHQENKGYLSSAICRKEIPCSHNQIVPDESATLLFFFARRSTQ